MKSMDLADSEALCFSACVLQECCGVKTCSSAFLAVRFMAKTR